MWEWITLRFAYQTIVHSSEFKLSRRSRNVSYNYVVVDHARNLEIGYGRAIYDSCRGRFMYFIKSLDRPVDIYHFYLYGRAVNVTWPV